MVHGVRPATILFDLDGTLADSFALIAGAFRHACRAVLGREATEAEVLARWGLPLPLRLAGLDAGRVPDLLAAYSAWYDAHHAALLRPFPGVPAMVRALAGLGVRLGVVTSKRRGPALRDLEALGLAPFLETVVAAEDAAAPKPAPDPVREALRCLRMARAGAWMVGDGPLDIEAGRRAGVLTVGAAWGALDRAALVAAAPDYLAERPEDVVALASGTSAVPPPTGADAGASAPDAGASPAVPSDAG